MVMVVLACSGGTGNCTTKPTSQSKAEGFICESMELHMWKHWKDEVSSYIKMTWTVACTWSQ